MLEQVKSCASPCEVWVVGARADAEVYAEAAARVRAASGQRLEISKLADVIERLGKLSGGVTVPAAPAREPVPDWLAARLVHTVGMAPQDVAALSLEEAVDRWGETRCLTRTDREREQLWYRVRERR